MAKAEGGLLVHCIIFLPHIYPGPLNHWLGHFPVQTPLVTSERDAL